MHVEGSLSNMSRVLLNTLQGQEAELSRVCQLHVIYDESPPVTGQEGLSSNQELFLLIDHFNCTPAAHEGSMGKTSFGYVLDMMPRERKQWCCVTRLWIYQYFCNPTPPLKKKSFGAYSWELHSFSEV